MNFLGHHFKVEGSHHPQNQPFCFLPYPNFLLLFPLQRLGLVCFNPSTLPSISSPPPNSSSEGWIVKMATLSVAVPQATFTPNAMAGATRNSGRRQGNVVYIGGLSSFGGLKVSNNVSTLGMPTCTNQSFTKVLSSMRSATYKKGKGGGALSSTCNAAEEIFRIAGIMNGLVLIGVAVGFVLLRIEASLEEEA